MSQRFLHAMLFSIVLATAMVACGPAGSTADRPGASGNRPAAAPKQLTLAIVGDPVTVFPGIDQRQASASAELQDLVNARFTRSDHEDVLYPQLAEAVPTIENGLWKAFPDGTMETTYRLANAVTWHDGTPLTMDDFVFSLKVQQDQELAFFGNIVLSYIDGVSQPDARSATFHWKRLYINADGLTLVPMPKHIVEPAYLQNKQSLLDLPVWSTEAVGSGAYRVKDFQRGSHAVLDAFDGYVLGRPKIDTITARFIQDQNTVTANLLAGAVDATIGRGISIEQAVSMRNQWTEGRIADLLYHSWVRVHPQFINPTPAVILEVPFRQALLHAVDRQQIIDTVQEGVGAISEIGLSINSPYYKAIESNVVKYPFDTRRSAQLLEGLGYTRGPDGMLVDRAGTRLAVELRTTADNAARVKSMQVIADDWQKVGVAVDQVVVPAQLQGDRAYRQERPGFEVNRVGADLNGITSYHTRSVQTAANNYRPSGGGTNYPRYSNPELDEILDRFERTLPMNERLQVAGQAYQHMTSRVVQLGMYYDVQPTMVHNRVSKNFIGYTWDAHEWEVTA
jgi:peptide/nickel transport system substrate-binding protein